MVIWLIISAFFSHFSLAIQSDIDILSRIRQEFGVEQTNSNDEVIFKDLITGDINVTNTTAQCMYMFTGSQRMSSNKSDFVYRDDDNTTHMLFTLFRPSRVPIVYDYPHEISNQWSMVDFKNITKIGEMCRNANYTALSLDMINLKDEDELVYMYPYLAEFFASEKSPSSDTLPTKRGFLGYTCTFHGQDCWNYRRGVADGTLSHFASGQKNRACGCVVYPGEHTDNYCSTVLQQKDWRHNYYYVDLVDPGRSPSYGWLYDVIAGIGKFYALSSYDPWHHDEL